jgi:hypothetical protein
VSVTVVTWVFTVNWAVRFTDPTVPVTVTGNEPPGVFPEDEFSVSVAVEAPEPLTVTCDGEKLPVMQFVGWLEQVGNAALRLTVPE